MDILTLDFETYYDDQYSLKKMTMQEYILDSRFEAIGFSVKINGYVAEWFSGTHDEIKDHLMQYSWEDSALLCQNTMFDAAIMAWVFGIHPYVLMDTLAMSRGLYPHERSHSLAAQLKREGLGEKGTEVIMAKGKRRADFAPDELHRYGLYCNNDADRTYDLACRYLPRFQRSELRLIDSTLRMYTKPQFELDGEGLVDHLAEVITHKESLFQSVLDNLSMPNASFSDLKVLLASNQKFAAQLDLLGVEPPMKISPTTGKPTFAFAKTDEAFKDLEDHDDPRIQALVAARLGTKSTLEETRTARLITCADLAPTVPIALRFYGAWTGRWSADSAGALNFQNLPRKSKIKSSVRAPEGQLIVSLDLSNIELRLALWLAGQWDKVDMIRNGRDLYKDTASKTNNVPYEEVPGDMRQTFKVVCLSAVYQTGAARLQNTLRIMAKQKIPLDQCKRMIYAYRDEHDMVVKAWEACHEALLAIVERRKVPDLFRGLVTWDWAVQGFLLPSGLHLQMPGLRKETNKEGKQEFVFDGAYGAEKTYGGKVFQGLTQALARCIIATGWLRVEKRHPIALSVHDSLYWLVDEDKAQESYEWGLAQITAPVKWCPDLPLAAEGGFAKTMGGIK